MGGISKITEHGVGGGDVGEGTVVSGAANGAVGLPAEGEGTVGAGGSRGVDREGAFITGSALGAGCGVSERIPARLARNAGVAIAVGKGTGVSGFADGALG